MVLADACCTEDDNLLYSLRRAPPDRFGQVIGLLV